MEVEMALIYFLLENFMSLPRRQAGSQPIGCSGIKSSTGGVTFCHFHFAMVSKNKAISKYIT